MKKLLIIALLAVAMPVAGNSFQCGITPIKPISCIKGRASCQCDSQGNCHWVWVDC